MASADGGDAPAGGAPQTQSGRLTARLAAIDEDGSIAAPDDGDADGAAQLLGRLDQVLTWLWRVHGVDYYGGRCGPLGGAGRLGVRHGSRALLWRVLARR
jgi:hypothetical protein